MILRSSIIMYNLHEREFAIFRFFLRYFFFVFLYCLSGCWCLKEDLCPRDDANAQPVRSELESRVHFRQRTSWNIGGTKSGDPPFPFFPPVHPCRLHRCHTFIPRALTHVCREFKARGDEENKEKEVATVYHHQVDGYPDDILLFIVTVQIYIYIYYFSVILIIFHFTILLWLLIKLY